VLFDTGCHPDAADRRGVALGRHRADADLPPQDTVVHQLSLAGLAASDIDVVVCSTCTWTMRLQNGFFPKRRDLPPRG